MANEGKDEGEKNMTERKLTRREFLRVAATFGAAGALSACVPGGPQTVEKIADTLAPTQKPQEPTVVPTIDKPASTEAPTATPTSGQVIQETPTATPVPEKPISCDEANVDSELFKQGFQIGITVPVLSSLDTFGGTIPDGMESQVRSHLSELTEETTIQAVVIPSYLDPNHLQELVKQDTGRDSLPYKIESYYEGIDMKNNTILISPHASVVEDGGGYDLGLWRDAVIGTIQDRYYVKGKLMDWAINSSGEKVLMSVPGQNLYEGEADIAIVPNCLPRIVRRQGINKITGILDSNTNIIENPGLAWQVNPQSEERYIVNNGQVLEATSEGPKVMTLPEGVERVDYVQIHTNLKKETAAYGIEIQNGVDEIAVVKYNGREWKKLNKTVGIAWGSQWFKDNSPEGFEQQISAEVDLKEIKRLITSDKKNVPFGIIEEVPYEENGKITKNFIKVSGYPVGIYTYDAPNGEGPMPFHFLMFRVPGKFEDQDILVLVQNVDWYYRVGTVLDGNVGNIKDDTLEAKKLISVIEKSVTDKMQMIVQLDTVPLDENKFKDENERVARMFEVIKSGDSINIEAYTNFDGPGNRVIFDKSLLG